MYHLKGGILKYLEEVPQEESLWDGACFVFDERVSVEHGLKRATTELKAILMGERLKRGDKQALVKKLLDGGRL